MVVLERPPGLRALRRSRELVRRQRLAGVRRDLRPRRGGRDRRGGDRGRGRIGGHRRRASSSRVVVGVLTAPLSALGRGRPLLRTDLAAGRARPSGAAAGAPEPDRPARPASDRAAADAAPNPFGEAERRSAPPPTRVSGAMTVRREQSCCGRACWRGAIALAGAAEPEAPRRCGGRGGGLGARRAVAHGPRCPPAGRPRCEERRARGRRWSRRSSSSAALTALVVDGAGLFGAGGRDALLALPGARVWDVTRAVAEPAILPSRPAGGSCCSRRRPGARARRAGRGRPREPRPDALDRVGPVRHHGGRRRAGRRTTAAGEVAALCALPRLARRAPTSRAACWTCAARPAEARPSGASR